MGVVCFLSSVLGVGRIGAINRKVSKCEIANIWVLGNRNIKVADAAEKTGIKRKVEVILGRLKGSRS